MTFSSIRQSSRSHSHRASIATSREDHDEAHPATSLDSTAIEHRSRRGSSDYISQRSSGSRFHSHRASIATPNKLERAACTPASRFHSHRASIATSLHLHGRHILTSVSIPQPSRIDRDGSATSSRAVTCLSRFHSHRASIATGRAECSSIAATRSLDSTAIEHRSRPPRGPVQGDAALRVSIPQPSSIDRDDVRRDRGPLLFLVSIPQPSSIDRDVEEQIRR